MNAKTMIHLWGNPLASIDLETTGDTPGYHEIIQIAIVPLDMSFRVADDIKPFYQSIKPKYPERADPAAMHVNKLDLNELILNAPSSERVMDFLVEWFNGLPLGAERRLTPLAFNWAFERSFLFPWLGREFLNHIFTVMPRDVMTLANSLNDRAGLLAVDIPFREVKLSSMCRQFGIEQRKSHNALSDAIDTAKLYGEIMRAIIR